MSTIEMRLREGLRSSSLLVTADPALKERVVERGRRKRAVRRALGSVALACVAVLAVVTAPRLDELAQPRFGAATRPPYTGTVAARSFELRLPESWRPTERSREMTVFRPSDRGAGVAVVAPGAASDPEGTFDGASPGSFALAVWASRLPLEDSVTGESRLADATATTVTGWFTGGDDSLLRLSATSSLDVPEGSFVAVIVPERPPLVVITWQDESDSSWDQDIEDLLASLRFRNLK